MDSRLFDTILPNHQIFKDVKKSLQENCSTKLYNLIELKDDVLYAWNSIENSLFSLNINHLEKHPDNTPYQKLQLVSPPAFKVEQVMSSSCGSRLCLFGSRGVFFVVLPNRWGRGGLFDSGSETVLCKSYALDERFLYSQGDVCRVQWHPKSLSHVMVLLSDNTLRLYNIALKTGPKLVKVITIGPKPSSLLAGKTILDSLGDTAVDFTPLPESDSLLILRGDGEVYVVECNLDTKSPLQPKVSGPLAIYPSADDNYGSESCTICVLGGGDSPALVVVIATCSGALYHCVLLPAPVDKENDDTYALYVTESVKLTVTHNADAGDLHQSYPVHLYPCTNNTYACMHMGGVHTISLPILEQLQDYVLADDEEQEGALSTICSRSSTAQHLVQWESAGYGLRVMQGSRPMLLLLSANGELITRNLDMYDLEEQLYKEIQIKNPHLQQEDLDNILKEKQKISFSAIAQEILAREISQPILRLDRKQEPSHRESLELLTGATMRLRSEYMARQARAQEALARKAAALGELAGKMAAWRGSLSKDIEKLRAKSMELDAKRDLAEKQQEELKNRCTLALRGIRTACAPTGTERVMLMELQRYRQETQRLDEQLQLLKQRKHHRSDQLRKWHEEYKKKQTALGKSHSDTVSAVLQQQTSQISSLIEETKLLKDQLGIV